MAAVKASNPVLKLLKSFMEECASTPTLQVIPASPEWTMQAEFEAMRRDN